jgi:hypothetical protein
MRDLKFSMNMELLQCTVIGGWGTNRRNEAYVECKHLIKKEVSKRGLEEKERRQSWALPIKVPIINNYQTYIFYWTLTNGPSMANFG